MVENDRALGICNRSPVMVDDNPRFRFFIELRKFNEAFNMSINNYQLGFFADKLCRSVLIDYQRAHALPVHFFNKG